MATGGAKVDHKDSTFECDMSGDTSHVDLFLIGTTGHGKSATGNYLLGFEAFKTSDSGVSETKWTEVAWARREGKIIKIVDMPGLADTRFKRTHDQLNTTEQSIGQALIHCHRGFHALLFVLKYGNCFTLEEKHTVDTLKAMLGDTVIKNHCILLFTHGDSFDLNSSGKSFEEWCKEQEGDLGNLIKECKERCLLLYNKDQKRSDSTFRALMEILRVRIKNNRRYTSRFFKGLTKIRNEFIAKESALELWETAGERLMLIVRAIKQFSMPVATKEAKTSSLKAMKADANELHEAIKRCKISQESAERGSLKDTIETLKNNVNQLETKFNKKGASDKDLEEKIKKISRELEEIHRQNNASLEQFYADSMEQNRQ